MKFKDQFTGLIGKLFKKFGSKDVLKEHKFKTLEAMLYELEESLVQPEKELKLSSLVLYFNSILAAFKKAFREVSNGDESLELVRLG